MGSVFMDKKFFRMFLTEKPFEINTGYYFY